MKREIAPEAYNYNKFPGPIFARVGDKIVSEGIELDLLENHKDAFNQTVFGQRFSQIMLQYDFIVGDWGNEQLRLKGFYKDDKTVKSDAKISRLEDYLLEFCNFGCAYFVLGNSNPQALPVEVEDKPRRRRNRSNRNKKPNRFTVQEKEAKMSTKEPQKREKRQSRKKKSTNKSEAKHSFVIRKKGE